MSASPEYLAACATFDETVEVLRQWMKTRLPSDMAKELEGLADCLEDAHAEGTASVSALDMREELTLCPDGSDHYDAECSYYGCLSWVREGRP